MGDYYDSTLTPAPPYGLKEGVGETPYPFNDTADVHPQAPRGKAEGVGDSPYPNMSTEPFIPAGRHTNEDFDCHRSGLEGPEKPGPF